MRKSLLIFALLAFAATAGAYNAARVDALPLDSIKPLRIMKADKAGKAIDTKTKEELKETKKPAARNKSQESSANTTKDMTAEQPMEHTDTPIKINQRTQGVFNVPNTEDMPTYPGGEKALREFIRSNRQYPEECKARRISGKVTVSITIAPDGVPGKMEITSSSGNEAMDAEAMRVAELMPAWTPAKDPENGKERIYNMTFTFRPGR
ncbi:MAG: energy transducer TonB [Bacteroidales bacterium]|nr:energy transducer TonB [Bacteroidales bacterium]